MKAEAKQDYRRLKIKPGDICGSPAKNPLLLLMYILMRQQGASDFNDDRITLDQIGSKEMHLHHIFPWDFMMKDARAIKLFEKHRYSRGEYRAMVNDLANLTFLRQSTNSSIGKQEPGEYLISIPAPTRRAHFIPENQALWHPDRYEDFLDGRRRLISDAINGFLKRLG